MCRSKLRILETTQPGRESVFTVMRGQGVVSHHSALAEARSVVYVLQRREAKYRGFRSTTTEHSIEL